MQSVFVVGASSGFGRDMSLELARRGWQVFAGMRDVAKGASLRRQSPDNLRLIEIDVTSNDSVEKSMRQVLEQSAGRLDAVVCNAGFGQVGFFEELTDAQCRAQMETNFFGAIAVARLAIPVMREARKGRIVVISSNAVNTPHPMLSMYAASKWALEGWAEGVAMELAPFGVEVVVVEPGAHRTTFASNVRFQAHEGSPYSEWMAQATQGLSNLDRWGRPPERATEVLVDSVEKADMPFRTCLGEDTVAFNRLKGVMPYEWRAWAVRAIAGLPGVNQYVDSRGDRFEPTSAAGGEVTERLRMGASGDPEFGRMLVALLTSDATRRG